MCETCVHLCRNVWKTSCRYVEYAENVSKCQKCVYVRAARANAHARRHEWFPQGLGRACMQGLGLGREGRVRFRACRQGLGLGRVGRVWTDALNVWHAYLGTRAY